MIKNLVSIMENPEFYEEVTIELYLAIKRKARLLGVSVTTYARYLAIMAFSPPYKEPWN